MGLAHSATSSALYGASDDMGLNEFTWEAAPARAAGGRNAEPLEVLTTDAGLLWFAPEKELRVFSVIEQYEPADLDRIDSARPFAPGWDGRRVAWVVLLVAIFTGLPVDTQVLPEPSRAYPQVRQVSTVEARSAAAAAAIVPASAPLPNPGRTVGRPPANAKVSSFAAQSRAALELNTIRQALASLEGQNVPLERCTARVAAYERVVARCGNEPTGEWTLDFNRALDRWQVVGAPAR